MPTSRKRSRKTIKQSLMVLAAIAMLPTTTGALANTLAENLGLAHGYQVAPPATRSNFRQTRGGRIDHLEQSAARIRLRILRLEAEGQEHRVSILQYRLGKLEAELQRLRSA